MSLKRLHLMVSGMVQGVFYRANVQAKAVSLGLKGWVRNIPDGRVEAVAEGEEDKLMELYDYCKDNPGYARVDDVVAEWEKPTGEFKDFVISYPR